MSSLLKGFEYDIFISYRQNDNHSDKWVSNFVNALKEELEATIKNPVSIYFDENPHDGLLETHQVDASLAKKLKCMVFIPIVSQTYCDTHCFAWRHELLPFIKMAKEDELGMNITLSNGNVASRVLPIKIHDLDAEDQHILEEALDGPLRSIDFIYNEPGVNRPLSTEDKKEENLNTTNYKNQVNKVANALKDIGVSILKQSDGKVTVPIAASVPPANETKPKNRNKVLFASIAVLPFNNLSNDDEQQYFADGVMEDILTHLQRMKELRVTSRTSVRQYRNTTKSAKEIGSELYVSFLLEGSVRRAENQIMISAQLISTEDDRHIWADNFTSKYSTEGLFDIQREIAVKIARELELKISPKEISDITKSKTTSKEAYNNYQKGQEILQRGSGTKEELDLAVLKFQQAIEMDSNFSMAYIGLANTYLTYVRWGRSSSKDFVPKAMETALKAQRIGDEMVESYQTLGTIYIYLNDLKTAEEYLSKVVEMSPNYVESYYWLGMLNTCKRNKKQALKFFDMAGQLDPRSSRFISNIAEVFYNFREYDKALEEIYKVLKFHPNDTFALFWLANIYTAKGEYQKAIDIFHKRIVGTNTNWSLGYAYGLAGNKEEATRILNYQLEKKEREYVPPFMIGVIYIGLGNKEEAINWLERGYAESNNPILTIRFRSMLDPLKDEPRLNDLLDRMEIVK